MSDNLSLQQQLKFVNNMKQKYDAFVRNGFVLPKRKSPLVTNDYLENVSNYTNNNPHSR